MRKRSHYCSFNFIFSFYGYLKVLFIEICEKARPFSSTVNSRMTFILIQSNQAQETSKKVYTINQSCFYLSLQETSFIRFPQSKIPKKIVDLNPSKYFIQSIQIHFSNNAIPFLKKKTAEYPKKKNRKENVYIKKIHPKSHIFLSCHIF